MKKFFFQKDIVTKLIILSLVLLLVLPIEIFFLWIILVCCSFFLYRRNKVSYKNSLPSSVDIVLAPSNGVIGDIINDDEQKKIKIIIPWWGPFGLYMPNSSEVSNSEYKGKVKSWRKRKIKQVSGKNQRAQVELENKLGQKIKISVLRCFYGLAPQLWLRAGDRGRSCACMGIFPFGGSIIIELPKESEILVGKSEKVKAGFTILAGMKG